MAKKFSFEDEFGGTTAEDQWQTSSGLPLANADVQVVALEFGYNAKLGSDILCANFQFAPIDDDGELGEVIDQSFSVGKGWEAVEKGAFLIDENGSRTRTVNGQTNFGRLVNSAVAAIKESGEEFPFLSPRIASGWVGTRWHIGTEQVTSTNPQTGKESVKDAFVAAKYLGKIDEAAGVKAAGSKASATGGSKKAKDADEDDETQALRKRLLELAREHDDHDDFVDAAFKIDGVEGGPLERAVMRSKGDGSIWAEAKS